MFILKQLMKHLTNFSWLGIFITVLFHMATTYASFFLVGETELLDNFFYYYVVTASTVGYGDFSPSSTMGKYIVSLWLIPGGIALFTAILGKAISIIQTKATKMKNGMGSFKNFDQHVIVVGYKQGDTERLFRETNQKLGNTEKVVVCTETQCSVDNWVKAETYTDKDAYERAGIFNASRIVIMLDNDGATTNVIMTLMSIIGKMKVAAKLPEVIAFVDDEMQAELIRNNFPLVECVVSNKVSYLARSMSDPGISEIFEALSSSAQGHTLYSYKIQKNDSVGRSVNDFEKNGSSVIAVKTRDGKISFVNNHNKMVLIEDDVVYYISEKRIG